MAKHRIFATSVSSVYPLNITKSERKGRTHGETHEIPHWLTDYSQEAYEAKLAEAAEEAAAKALLGASERV